MSITSKDDLLKKQIEAQEEINSYTCRILVCSGTGCVASGSQKIYDEMCRLCEGIDIVKASINPESTPGTISGNTTLKNALTGDAPRSRAAS